MKTPPADATPNADSRPSRNLRDAAILAFALLFPSALTWAYFVLGEDLADVVAKTIFGVGKTLQFAFPALVATFVLKTRVLARRPNRRGLLVGGLFGLAVGLTIFFAGRYLATSEGDFAPLFARFRDELTARLTQFGLASRGRFLVVLVFYSIFHSGLEEYYWRWFAFGRLNARLGSPVAAALGANAAFTLHHVVLLGVYFGYANALTWVCAFGVFAGGLVWQAIYRKTDSIYGAWLSHGLIDAGIFSLGLTLLPTV